MIAFDRLNDAWKALPKASCQFYKIGPFTIQICSHNRSVMTKLTQAFAHLMTNSSSPPDLTICLWSDRKLPPLDWSLIHTNGYRGYANPPFYFHYFETIGALSAIDTQNGIAYYAIRDPKKLPWWVSGSPLQVIFHVYFRKKGIQLTHSACIANDKSGVLLAGKGGSGKSTTVLACLKEGFSSLGEDYVLLAPDHVYSIYQTAKWCPYTRILCPEYESYIENRDVADQEKALVHYRDLFPSQMISSSPLHAVVSLDIGTSAHLRKSNLQTSLQSLLLSTVMQLPHPDPCTARLLYGNIKTLDHFHLSLGPDLKENVSLLKEVFL